METHCSCSHLTALGVQAHSHGSPLHKCWKLSDYCQELVAANMKQLHVERVRWSECDTSEPSQSINGNSSNHILKQLPQWIQTWTLPPTSATFLLPWPQIWLSSWLPRMTAMFQDRMSLMSGAYGQVHKCILQEGNWSEYLILRYTGSGITPNACTVCNTRQGLE